MSSQTVDEVFYALALLHSPGIGHANAKFALSHYPDLSEIFRSNKSRILRIPGVGEQSAKGILTGEGQRITEDILSKAEKKSIQVIPYTSKSYPKKLRQIIDAPFVLYFKGNHSLDFDRTVGIVGTRDATHYGKQSTEKIIKEIKVYQPAIISGLAYGIDIEAHRQALAYELPTVAVLAGGLDRIYPSIHQKTTDKMLETGGILSEQPPDTKPDAHLFPARNRIIAGLSDALIVVEAKEKGGALITAGLADSYDKTVFAVPGNLDQPASIGCNHLIRNQKAIIFTGGKDLEYHLNWDQENQIASSPKREIPQLNPEEQRIYEALLKNVQGVSIDDLAWKCSIPVNTLSSTLLSLEFKGLVNSLPGKKYKGIN